MRILFISLDSYRIHFLCITVWIAKSMNNTTIIFKIYFSLLNVINLHTDTHKQSRSFHEYTDALTKLLGDRSWRETLYVSHTNWIGFLWSIHWPYRNTSLCLFIKLFYRPAHLDINITQKHDIFMRMNMHWYACEGTCSWITLFIHTEREKERENLQYKPLKEGVCSVKPCSVIHCSEGHN